LSNSVAIGAEWDGVYIGTFVKARYVGAFDASGKEDLRCIVVAGFVSSSRDWQAFHEAWTTRLSDDGLTYFHMTEFAHSQGAFQIGWKGDNARREKLFGDLVGIIKSHVYRSFACTVEYEHFFRLSASNQKEFAMCAYSLAARTCLRHISDWKKRETGLSCIPIGYAFEEGDEGASMLSDRMWKDGYPRPHFLPKKDGVRKDGSPANAYTPVQAADILAYEIFRLYHDHFEPTPRFTSWDKYRWGIKQFWNHAGSSEWGCYEPKDLEDLNARFSSLSADRKTRDLGDGIQT
jgi:hypothetical protein